MWRLDSPNEYMKKVLSPAHKAFLESGGILPDEFTRYMLELDASPADIKEAIARIPSVWDQIRVKNAKYERLCSRLKSEHAAKSQLLLDESARQLLLKAVQDRRQKEDRKRLQEVQEGLSVVVSRKGFITNDELDELVNRARKSGLSRDDVVNFVKHSKLRVKEEEPPVKLDKGLPDATRKQIQNNLAFFGNRDLYDYLDLQVGSDKTAIAAKWREKEDAVRKQNHDDARAANGRILGFVKQHMIDGDPALYEASLLYETAEKMRDMVVMATKDGFVDEMKYRKLVKHGMTKHGMTEELVRQYIVGLAHEFGAKVAPKPIGPTISCARCTMVSPLESGRSHCENCGDALWSECPKCSARTPTAEQRCSKCGFEVQAHSRVQLLFREIELYLEEGVLETAASKLTELEAIWKPDEKTQALRKAISSRRKAAQAEMAELDAALAQRKLNMARHLLVKLGLHEADQKLPNGITGKDMMQQVVADLRKATLLVQKARHTEDTGQLDNAAVLYLKAKALSTDLEEIDQGLARCPPSPPTSLSVRVLRGSVVLEWSRSSSKGDIKYIVMRSTSIGGHKTTSSEELSTTRDTSFTDKNPPIAIELRYKVLSVRDKARSRAVESALVHVIADVRDLKLRAADASVSGTWSLPAPNLHVRVFRNEGRSLPKTGVGTEIPVSGNRSFVDQGVSNGTQYTYRVVSVLDLPDGTALKSRGIQESCCPQEPPLPVTDLRILVREKEIEFIWTPPPRGEILIARSASAPSWAGKELAKSALDSRIHVVSESLSGAATDTILAGKPVFYTPITVLGDQMIAGSSQRFIALPQFEQLKAEHFGSYVQLTWTWSDRCAGAFVAWRHDAFPSAPSDISATTLRISRAEYESKGGVRVDASEAESYKFAVYPHVMVSGTDFFGSGIQAEVGAGASIALHYSITRKRFGAAVILELWASESIPELPELVLVARSGGIQPLRAEDGEPTLVLSGYEVPTSGRSRHNVPLDGIKRPVFLRLFFRDESEGKRYEIVDPKANECKVR